MCVGEGAETWNPPPFLEFCAVALEFSTATPSQALCVQLMCVSSTTLSWDLCGQFEILIRDPWDPQHCIWH